MFLARICFLIKLFFFVFRAIMMRTDGKDLALMREKLKKTFSPSKAGGKERGKT